MTETHGRSRPAATGRTLLARTARATARGAGRLTHGSRMLPSFLIVGAQRCGTTSLYRALTAHPSVLPAVLHKGVHYFDTGYGHDPEWYRGHFPLLGTARTVRARTGTWPATGESSPYYMFHPLAPGRIARDLPEVKLIVLLRDPVERAYSAHTHETARGFETETFERALELEPERLAGTEERISADPTWVSYHHQHHAYLRRGHYADQLERLERAVGRERIHVLESERFFRDPGAVLTGTFDFLGLTGPDDLSAGRHNPRPRAQMPPRLRRSLEEHFRPHDERLAEWLGIVPAWRR